jgi:hypothetical protein
MAAQGADLPAEARPRHAIPAHDEIVQLALVGGGTEPWSFTNEGMPLVTTLAMERVAGTELCDEPAAAVVAVDAGEEQRAADVQQQAEEGLARLLAQVDRETDQALPGTPEEYVEGADGQLVWPPAQQGPDRHMLADAAMAAMADRRDGGELMHHPDFPGLADAVLHLQDGDEGDAPREEPHALASLQVKCGTDEDALSGTFDCYQRATTPVVVVSVSDLPTAPQIRHLPKPPTAATTRRILAAVAARASTIVITAPQFAVLAGFGGQPNAWKRLLVVKEEAFFRSVDWANKPVAGLWCAVCADRGSGRRPCGSCMGGTSLPGGAGCR